MVVNSPIPAREGTQRFSDGEWLLLGIGERGRCQTVQRNPVGLEKVDLTRERGEGGRWAHVTFLRRTRARKITEPWKKRASSVMGGKLLFGREKRGINLGPEGPGSYAGRDRPVRRLFSVSGKTFSLIEGSPPETTNGGKKGRGGGGGGGGGGVIRDGKRNFVRW